VLPFANLSSDPENEYLSDGLTDEIIGTLGRVRGLRVAGRNSCFALKGQSLEPRIVAQRLGVTAVVEGSVRRAGNRIRVSAELVQTADGFQLWSDRYDRDLTDIFAVQEEIAGMIAGALTNRLTTPDPATDTKAAARPENPEAYRLYLQAMHVLRNQFTPDSFDRVIALTENALAADTTLARAHMARAVVHNNLAVYNMRPAHSVCPIALDAARTAVKLDPALAEAWSIEAQVACNYEWDWKRADECFARALAADPDDPGTLARAALFNAARGSEASAVAHARRVMVVDPLSAWSHFVAAAAFRMLRRDDDAASASREALALNPHHGLALTTLAGTLLNQGNVDAAIEGYERACTLTGRNPIPLAGLCIAHAIGKTRDRAESCLAELMAVQRERPSLVWLGYALGALGRLDEAMTCMEQAAEAREFWLAWMNADPFSDVLRSERRFDALMRRVGTPAYRPIETMLGTSAVRLS
jgi:TolB-like protein/tetratricopeptide (TPR) repeat protein